MPGKVFESGSFIKTILISYSGIDQGKESGLFLSKYVLDYLRKKVVLGLNHSIVGKLGADWQFTRQERNGTYTKWNGSAYGSEVPYSLVNLLNTRIYWQQKNLMIYVEAANLLDQRYIDYGNIEQPGRWIKVGFRKQFDLETKN
jgi:iron complex outermembrane receptor protein